MGPIFSGCSSSELIRKDWNQVNSQKASKKFANRRIKNLKKVVFDISKMEDVFIEEASVN